MGSYANRLYALRVALAIAIVKAKMNGRTWGESSHIAIADLGYCEFMVRILDRPLTTEPFGPPVSIDRGSWRLNKCDLLELARSLLAGER